MGIGQSLLYQVLVIYNRLVGETVRLQKKAITIVTLINDCIDSRTILLFTDERWTVLLFFCSI